MNNQIILRYEKKENEKKEKLYLIIICKLLYKI